MSVETDAQNGLGFASVAAMGMPSMKAMRRAVGRVRSSQGDGFFGIYGDSTWMAQGAGPTNPYIAGSRPFATPNQIAAILTGMGLPASADNIFGNNTVDSTSRVPSAYFAYNTELTASVSGTSDWFLENLQIPGGYPWRNTSGTGLWSYTPVAAFDTIDVYTLNVTGCGVVAVDIGGAALATIDTGITTAGATAVVKTVVLTGGAPATGTINIKRTGSGGYVRILGVVPRNSAAKKLHLLNMACSGWQTSHFADATGPWSPARAASVYGLDGALITLGLNDLANSVAVPTSRANLVVLIDYLQASAVVPDIWLGVPHPQDPATRDPLGNTAAYNAMIYELAGAKGCGVIDFFARQQSYAVLNATGMLRDTVHGKPELYADNAAAVARTLLAA